ncbi:hypothetical protein AVEN_244774-1 [Araneus ventricosus]|uniref:Uncharacterized protein n=1 Tax=Araneus ventricosus TaxID=182803 RepID=A0A4Y2BRW8_ARAVE|nr:hypothetical protein AVEN_244774-1 [Araneus ventricosus]
MNFSSIPINKTSSGEDDLHTENKRRGSRTECQQTVGNDKGKSDFKSPPFARGVDVRSTILCPFHLINCLQSPSSSEYLSVFLPTLLGEPVIMVGRITRLEA